MRSPAAAISAPLAAIVVVPPAIVDTVAAVAAEVPIAVARPAVPTPAMVPAPVVTAARVPPMTGAAATTAVDAAATLEMAEAMTGNKNNITNSPFIFETFWIYVSSLSGVIIAFLNLALKKSLLGLFHLFHLILCSIWLFLIAVKAYYNAFDSPKKSLPVLHTGSKKLYLC